MRTVAGISTELVDGALAGNPQATGQLVAALTPVIQARVNRALALRYRQGGRAPSRADVLDLTQDVFLALLDNDGRVLRSWKPERGLSLQNFVGMVAERRVGAVMRSGRRSGWAEDPTEQSALQDSVAVADEPKLESRELLAKMLERMRQTLSPRGLSIFEALIVRERPPEEVARSQDISVEAVYMWRSRLRKTARDIEAELSLPSVPHASPSPSMVGGNR